MPIYVFACDNPKCKHQFELQRSIYDERNWAKCPKCNNIATKIIVNTSFILKPGGVGWSSNGYSK